MSWDQLLAIRKDQVQDAIDGERDRRVPPACPKDGQPMITDASGGLVCGYDGYRP